MDYSKLSDSALEQIANGKVDYSTLTDADLEHIAGAESKAEAKAPEGNGKSFVRGALRYGTPVVGGLVGVAAGSPLIGGPLGYAAGKEIGRLGEHYLLGDELPQESPKSAALRVAGNLAEGASGELLGPILTKAGPELVERFATSAIPGRIENMTNVAGAAENAMSRLAGKIGRGVSDKLGNAADLLAGLSTRGVVYQTPLAPIQGISDTAKAVGLAQRGVTNLLDKTAFSETGKALANRAAVGGSQTILGAIRSVLGGSK
jgi:hypothetical protein